MKEIKCFSCVKPQIIYKTWLISLQFTLLTHFSKILLAFYLKNDSLEGLSRTLRGV